MKFVLKLHLLLILLVFVGHVGTSYGARSLLTRRLVESVGNGRRLLKKRKDADFDEDGDEDEEYYYYYYYDGEYDSPDDYGSDYDDYWSDYYEFKEPEIWCNCRPGKCPNGKGYDLVRKIFASPKMGFHTVNCEEATLGRFNSTRFEIPSNIGRFKTLRTLTLKLAMKGTIPSSIGSLTNLEELSVTGKGLRGTLPTQIGNLHHLEHLAINIETHGGQIPDIFGEMHELYQIELTGSFHGTFPLSLTKLSSLRHIALEGQFAGTLPKELSEMSLLRSFDMFSPRKRARLENDQVQMEGGIPEEYGRLTSLRHLTIYGQGLTGTIPASLGALSFLRTLDLGANKISGTVPETMISKLKDLRVLQLSRNQFTGPFPTLSSNIQLNELRLGFNDFDRGSGGLPESLLRMNLTYLDIANANLDGTIPEWIGQLSNLRQLFLEGNEFQGRVPKLPQTLRYLYLGNNQLTGFNAPLEVVENVRVNLDGLELVCDCTLTSWFGEFFAQRKGGRVEQNILDNEESVLCSEVNSFSGIPVSWLRYSDSSPCSHPLDLAITNSTNKSLTLTWESVDQNLTIGQPVLKRALALHESFANYDGNCWDCSPLEMDPRDAPDEQRRNSPSIAFEIQYGEAKDVNNRVCCSVAAFWEKQAPVPEMEPAKVQFELNHGLHPFRKYAIEVRTIFIRFDQLTEDQEEYMSRFSSGPFTSTIFGQTSEAAPGTSPYDFIVESVQDTEFIVRWEPPFELNGVLKKYEVLYHRIEKEINDNGAEIPFDVRTGNRALSNSLNLNKTLNVATEFVRVQNLVPGSSYSIQVRAWTGFGPGPYSEPFVASTVAPCPPGTQKRNVGDGMVCSPCGIGLYRAEADEFCKTCPDTFPVTISNFSTSIEMCTTGRGFFKDLTVQPPLARQCDRGMVCVVPGLTSETVELKPGFWRESNRSIKVIPCKDPKACMQTSMTYPYYCTAHHTGVQCLTCDTGYAIKESDGVCEKCTEDEVENDRAALAAWGATLIILTCLGLMRIWYVAKITRASSTSSKEMGNDVKDVDPSFSQPHATFLEVTETGETIRRSLHENEEGTTVSPRRPLGPSEAGPVQPPTPSNVVLRCQNCRERFDEGQQYLAVLDIHNNNSETLWHPACMLDELQEQPMSSCKVELRVVPRRSQMSVRMSSVTMEHDQEVDWASYEFANKTFQQRMVERTEQFVEALHLCIWTKLRIFLGFLQVYFAFYKTFQSDVLNLDKFFGGLFALVDFDISELLHLFQVRCVWDQTHYDSLLLYTVFPIAFILLVWIVYVVVKTIYQGSRPAVLKAKTESTTIILFLFFMVYPGLSRKIFQTFLCAEYPTADGIHVPKRTLASDPRVSCDAENREMWMVYAGIMIAVYPVGIVLVYTALLFGIRDTRKKEESAMSHHDLYKLERIHFLHRPYTRKSYWFEAYELVRKVLQTTLVLFVIDATSSVQVGILVCQVLTSAAIVMLQKYEPYQRRTDFFLAMISQFVLLIACICALLDTFRSSRIVDGDVILTYGSFSLKGLTTAAFSVEVIAFLLFCIMDCYIFIRHRDRFNQDLAKGIRIRREAYHNDDSDDEDDNDNDDDDDDDDGDLHRSRIVSINVT